MNILRAGQGHLPEQASFDVVVLGAGNDAGTLAEREIIERHVVIEAGNTQSCVADLRSRARRQAPADRRFALRVRCRLRASGELRGGVGSVAESKKCELFALAP